MKIHKLDNDAILVRIKITILCLLIMPLGIHAQYRRRHADITRELVKILELPDTSQYYFSLLPDDLTRYICSLSGLNIESEMYRAFYDKRDAKINYSSKAYHSDYIKRKYAIGMAGPIYLQSNILLVYRVKYKSKILNFL